MKPVGLAVALFLLFALVGRCFAQADAYAARGRALVPVVENLTPQSVAAMPRGRLLDLFEEASDIMTGLESSLMSQPGMTEEKLMSYLAAQGIAKLLSEEFHKKFGLIGDRLLAEDRNGVSAETQRRYPAYAQYVKRSMVAEVVLALSAARTDVTEAYISTGKMPAPSESLGTVRGLPAVRNVSYENGLFRVTLNERIVDGGVVELRATPKSRDELQWTCSSSPNMRELAPGSCR
jgi:hypothetical protein